MAKGKHPGAPLSNITRLPLHDEPASIHYAKAEELRPDDLSEAELCVWNRFAPTLVMAGRLEPVYVPAFTEYCRVTARMTELRKRLDAAGWMYEVDGPNGLQKKPFPLAGQYNDDWRKWRSLVGEFGLAPNAARGVASNAKNADDGFDQF